jgi:hypothetical protein
LTVSNKRTPHRAYGGLYKRFRQLQGWKFSNDLSPKDFNQQFSSTVNRFYNFLDTEKLRLMFGQNGASLDLGKALEEGQIIIANLSTEGARVSEEDRFAVRHVAFKRSMDSGQGARQRDGGRRYKAVLCLYAMNFKTSSRRRSPRIWTKRAASACTLTLANQFPRQILHAGANGAQVYESVMGNARSKVVFSLEGDGEFEAARAIVVHGRD